MFITKLFDRSFDPARARRLPIRSEAGESNVRGLYLIGEIAGGFESTRDGQSLDILIVGAGSSGLGAADRCQELGLRYVVIEQLRQQRPAHDRRKGAGLKAVS